MPDRALAPARPVYVPRAATCRSRPPLPRYRSDISALATRVTARDLWLLRMLHEHRVLTTHHITALWNVSRRVANRRLRALHHLHAVDAFRPLVLRGSAPEHYTLGATGVHLLAAHHAVEPSALAWRKDTCARTAFSPTLDHDLAVNSHLTTLAASHHHDRDSELTVWISARSAARLWGDWARPDAYAHHRHRERLLPFFLEHDTGTQPLARVEGKLAGYAQLVATTGTATPILFHTSSPAREASLRRRLAPTAADHGLLVATTHADHPAAPGGGWLPLHPPAGERLPLAELAQHWPHSVPALTEQLLDGAATPAASAGHNAFPWQPVPPLPPASARW
ncbi:replication-relaxation family protein [Streptomyces sp. 4N509B]|uniref:replication-relaxation family protein n=1 Tax=Streptomyces sp. 4N509B TaxID=3457413 RepID=UPI003FD50CCA